MIINKSTQDILRVLLVEKVHTLTLREIAGKAGLSLGMAARIIGALESAGQLQKRRGVQLISWEKTLRTFAYTTSLAEYKKIEFLAAERPQYLIQKISQLLSKEQYAFTLFSATEIIAPYVAPDQVHLYLVEGEEKKITEILTKQGFMRAEKGNVTCYLVSKTHFYGRQEVQGCKIISLPQLYADLIAYGGRGEEAAEEVFKVMKRV